MARTPSTMLELGTPCPDFRLTDVRSGDVVARDDLTDRPGLLVAFISNHCPFVKHLREGLALFSRDYAERGLGIVGISPNDVANYPDDAPEKLKEEADTADYAFPYLYDETQEVAKAFRAACTPDFFLFDAERKLIYRGQFDASRPGNDVPVTGSDLRAAADAALAGQPVPADQRASLGCNIKWKAGNEPDYYAK